MNRKPVALFAIAAVAVVVLTGCSSPASPSSPARTKPADTLSGSIVVDAAASLTGTFDTVAAAFQRQHPAASVTFNYGGSGALAAAIVAGAPADVFAAASPATMTTVSTAKLTVGTPAVFVKNELEIVTPAGNPAGMTILIGKERRD